MTVPGRDGWVSVATPQPARAAILRLGLKSFVCEFEFKRNIIK